MAKTKSPARAGIWSAKDTAEFLGITTRWLLELTKQGVIIPVGRGKFEMPKAIHDFIRWHQEAQTRNNQSSSADHLRDQRAQEIAIKIAKQERDLIPLGDAMAAFEEATGVYLESLSGMPARITRVPRERQRIEAICDEERLRLSDRFGKSAKALQSGISDPETDDEVDS